MANAIVIGGGIVGLAIAHRLRQQGLAVTLLDYPPTTGKCASWGNAGHIAVEQVAPIASLATVIGAPRRLLSPHGALSFPPQAIAAWLPFSWRMVLAALPHRFEPGKSALTDLLSQAAPAWTKFAQSLGRPDHLRMDGHYITWCNDKAAAKGKRHWLTADTGTTQFREADANETEQIQTLTRQKIAGAIRCIGSGQIHDLSELLEDAKQRFLALGGTVMTDKVAMLLEQAGRSSVRLANGQTLTADIVIVAAGYGSKQLLETTGYRVPMIAERGYHVQYAPGAWSGDVPPVVFEEYGMIVTRFASVVRAASFVEFTTADSPADPKKWRHIERNVSELGLQLGARLDAWHGSRPTLPDYLPAIGKSKRAENLYYAFGHNHLGLTLAPITAEIIGAMVCGNVPAKAFSAFDLERFA